MRAVAYRIGEEALQRGKNISRTLRSTLGVDANTPEIIEVAYELQAGSYVRFANDNLPHVRAYAAQLAGLLTPHLRPGDVLLDVGCGEMTVLSLMVRALDVPLGRLLACDISARRLAVGRRFAARHMGPGFARLETFRAEIGRLPLPDHSVDIVTSNHALEPNGGREQAILAELLRVCRRKLVLFEPCREIASAPARARMARYAYVRGLADAAARAGGRVESVTPLALVDNPLNPTACFVIGS